MEGRGGGVGSTMFEGDQEGSGVIEEHGWCERRWRGVGGGGGWISICRSQLLLVYV